MRTGLAGAQVQAAASTTPPIDFCQEALSPPASGNLEYLLIDFGESESGNNFIEIGKEPTCLKSMLELCCS